MFNYKYEDTELSYELFANLCQKGRKKEKKLRAYKWIYIFLLPLSLSLSRILFSAPSSVYKCICLPLLIRESLPCALSRIYVFFHVNFPFFSISDNVLRFVSLSRHTVSGVFSRPLSRPRLITRSPTSRSSLQSPPKHIFSKHQSSPVPVLSRFASIGRASCLTKSGFALRIHMQSAKSRSPQREHTPITTMIIRVLDTRLRDVYTFSAHFQRAIKKERKS